MQPYAVRPYVRPYVTNVTYVRHALMATTARGLRGPRSERHVTLSRCSRHIDLICARYASLNSPLSRAIGVTLLEKTPVLVLGGILVVRAVKLQGNFWSHPRLIFGHT